MLNLNRISNIKYILETIDDEGLSSICRIFAITLSDLDMNEKKYWANAQKKQQQQQQLQSGSSSSQAKASTSKSADNTTPKVTVAAPLSVRDQNQELLLNIPSLLTRLVNLVRRKDYAIRYSGTSSELEHWMRYLDEALSDNDDTDTNNESPPPPPPPPFNNPANNNNNNINLVNNNDLDLMVLGDETNYTTDLNNNLTIYNNMNRTSPENQLYQPALLAATKLNNFVHVLYALSLLLIGKERKRVQKCLAKLRLASALNSLFDYLVWNCRCEYHNPANTAAAPEQQQMRSHICPEVAVKIQFLRLVHSFCDHSE